MSAYNGRRFAAALVSAREAGTFAQLGDALRDARECFDFEQNWCQWWIDRATAHAETIAGLRSKLCDVQDKAAHYKIVAEDRLQVIRRVATKRDALKERLKHTEERLDVTRAEGAEMADLADQQQERAYALAAELKITEDAEDYQRDRANTFADNLAALAIEKVRVDESRKLAEQRLEAILEVLHGGGRDLDRIVRIWDVFHEAGLIR